MIHVRAERDDEPVPEEIVAAILAALSAVASEPAEREPEAWRASGAVAPAWRSAREGCWRSAERGQGWRV